MTGKEYHPAREGAQRRQAYYLQSLCPVPAPMDDDVPTLIRLLAAPAAPASRPGAVLGLLLLTAFVLWIAGLAVRRMQLSYGTDT